MHINTHHHFQLINDIYTVDLMINTNTLYHHVLRNYVTVHIGSLYIVYLMIQTCITVYHVTSTTTRTSPHYTQLKLSTHFYKVLLITSLFYVQHEIPPILHNSDC